MAKSKRPEPPAGKAEYQPTEKEKTALRKQIDRIAASPQLPRVKVGKGENTPTIALDHPDDFIAGGVFKEALGTTSTDFTNGLINQLAKASYRNGKIDADGLNFMLSVIEDIKPRDQLESMLAAQMAAIHMAIMKLAQQLANVDLLPQQDSAGALLNKLTRTFATQIETLKRNRSSGEQKVTVQHVTVSEGGQAIVGNVTQAPDKNQPSESNTARCQSYSAASLRRKEERGVNSLATKRKINGERS